MDERLTICPDHGPMTRYAGRYGPVFCCDRCQRTYWAEASAAAIVEISDAARRLQAIDPNRKEQERDTSTS